jgi:hypothetical protein
MNKQGVFDSQNAKFMEWPSKIIIKHPLSLSPQQKPYLEGLNMELNEAITKAQQGIYFVVSDLEKAHACSLGIDRPEGQNRRDKALTAWLAKLMQEARQLQSALLVIGE